MNVDKKHQDADKKHQSVDIKHQDVDKEPVFIASLTNGASAYALAVECTADPVVITDKNEVIEYINPAFENIAGYSRSEVIGQNISLLNVDRPKQPFFADMHSMLARGEIWQGRLAIKRKDKSIVESDATIAAIRDQAGAIANYILVERDFTHVSQLEGQLRQAQKMEAIGTLAGGIAHDFNNLLMGIQGNVALSLPEIDPGSVVSENLQKIDQYVKSGVDLTQQLLGYARGGKYKVNLVDINELLDEQTRLFARTNKEIVFKTDFASQLWAAEVDPGQIEQVILNLYMNALQAMPTGGTIRIHTRNHVIEKEQFVPYQIKAGNYIKITVEDTGVGMDEKTQRRIFDPFFTTKEMGRGTGLGLASVYGIIKNHGGFINVSSQKGRGAYFEICLPASLKSVVKAERPAVKLKSGKETVLLVDDEEMIVDVGKRMLEKLGYNVLVAEDGLRAMEIYKGHRQDIDIVILDMVMPNMGGGETFDRIKAIDPDVTVLLSSGYSIDGQASEILSRGCNGFIQKPFDLKTLSEALREVLES